MADILAPWCRILFENLIVTQLVKKYPAFFMEPEGSLPCSRKSTTGPYLNQPNPVRPIDPYLPKVRMSFFNCLCRAKESVQVRGALKHFVTR
jgi:hypothetical protein